MIFFIVFIGLLLIVTLAEISSALNGIKRALEKIEEDN